MPTQAPFREQMDMIRWRHANERTSFRDELRVIPNGVYYILGLLIFSALVTVEIWNAVAGPLFPGLDVPSGLFGAGVVVATSIPFSCLILLITYINRDAGRRGMSRTLWTLIAIFIPYFVGVILYFVVREPLSYACPQCGAKANARFNYCASCSYNLRPACPQCHREVRPLDRYCPYCAFELKGSSASPSQVETPAT
ncbi:MAG: double zinc ribbon domain-containing protein [Terriglobia bacterium]